MVSCLEAHREVRAGVVENVPEFLDWLLYPAWVDALNRLGWAVSPQVALGYALFGAVCLAADLQTRET